MKWVHLRINTRVRVLGRLGCTGAFTRETEQHARVRLKNRRALFTVMKTGLQILKKLARLCRRAAQHVIYAIGTHSIYS